MAKRRRQRRTRRRILWGGVFSLTLALVVVMGIRAAQNEATLVLSPEAKDFGEIGRLQGTVTATFAVDSRGTAPLRIHRIVTS